MIQTLSLKLSRHLSSLAPKFEGHWWRVEKQWDDVSDTVKCEEDIEWQNSELSIKYEKICPAWQAEDVLRNLKAIALKQLWTPEKYMQVGTTIALYLYEFPDTACQKIEEYLWSILK